jgi:hypothetical protein
MFDKFKKWWNDDIGGNTLPPSPPPKKPRAPRKPKEVAPPPVLSEK